jgi:2,4-dienoyl-CoA reductase-like NADH-dependent reductase (Old Yellow Enzyme family)
VSNTALDSAIVLNNGTVIKNRLFKSAMSEQLADKHHNPSLGLIHLYKVWAKGGIGLSVTGNLMVDREHLGEPKNVVLDDKSDLSLFKKWSTAGTQNNCQLWAQLNHPGKQVPSFIHGQPLAPSALPLEGELQKNFKTPRALSDSEIEKIILRFSHAAKLAKQTGFSGVQIHGAHGYLVNQFLSPRHNKRNDKWGGSLENRMRFVLSVYKGIRKEVGVDFPVGIKLNSADFMRGGFTEQESMEVVKALNESGIDLIEISGGSYEAPIMADGTGKKSTQHRESYFLEYAEKVREITDTPIVVTGGFRSSKAMRAALASGATDFIGLARPLALDPEMPNKAIKDETFCVQSRPLTTGIKALDKMVMLNMSWYEVQLARMAKGQAPKLNLSEWYSTFKVFMHLGVFAFRKRRA